MRTRTSSPLLLPRSVSDTNNNIDHIAYHIVAQEKENKPLEKLHFLPNPSISVADSKPGNSLVDLVGDGNSVKEPLLRKFVKSALNMVSATAVRKDEKRTIRELFYDVKDSILGTSLRDELLEVLPSGEDGTFDNGTPNYVQSPLLMGNSLAAIGARNQMWESNSERMSSSSGSGGPVASFGQALRSAMVVREEHDENQAMTDSIGASSQDLAEHDESVNEVDSASGSRKSSVSAETSEKLCRIPREKGLDSQDFRCAMCRKTIGGPTFAKFETCAIDSKYYCTECMKTGGKVSIPARVVMDWDWRERPVSDRGRAWFEANQEKALINIQETNPRLYTHVPALAETRKLREKLHLVSMYLFACRDSVAEDFRRRLWPKEYLRSDIDLYSFADLMDVKSGALQRRLNHLFKHSVNHVMTCILCQQKGFCCKLCSVPEVLYPFHTETTHRCPVCFSVFHVHCWRSSDQCPKCERRRIFEISRAEINDPHNSLLVLQP